MSHVGLAGSDSPRAACGAAVQKRSWPCARVPRSIRTVWSSTGAMTSADLRPRSACGSQHAANAHGSCHRATCQRKGEVAGAACAGITSRGGMHAGSRCARACGACAGSRPGSPKMGVCAACLTGRFSSGTRSSCGVTHASLSSRSELTESPHPSSSEAPATTAQHGLSQQQPGIDGGFMLLTIWAASFSVLQKGFSTCPAPKPPVLSKRPARAYKKSSVERRFTVGNAIKGTSTPRAVRGPCRRCRWAPSRAATRRRPAGAWRRGPR